MEKFHRLVSTVLGIGYTPKGGGTIAAIACCLCWYFAGGGKYWEYIQLVVTGIVLVLGTWSADKVEAKWGKDSQKVVMDEVAGMCLTLLFIPVKWQLVLIGLVLFRFFDIVKPLYIRKLEALPGGWGVMMDDVLAGIYSNLILQLIVHMVKWPV